MELLYLTADKVGIQSGGGVVTKQEFAAFKSLAGENGACYLWDRNILEDYAFYEEPWKYDQRAVWALKNSPGFKPKLCHVYAGTFTQSIEYLKSVGCKITYTAAAHDIEVSKRSHEILSLPFNYPHLTEPKLWEQYVKGYLLADVLICPSKIAADTKRKYGYQGRVEIIPHGVDISDKPLANPSSVFTVGYLGAIGADKGLVFLLQAWKELNYKDGSKLVFAGKDSQHPFLRNLAATVLGDLYSTVEFLGWQEDVNAFYDSLSLYVQPSTTEGFGIEVLEAMSRGRPALVSVGAGAADVVPETYKFGIGDVKGLAAGIDVIKNITESYPSIWHSMTGDYTWEKIRQQYVNVWRNLL
jgi:glycosyltransferase involved in cell wall biosynthesis